MTILVVPSGNHTDDKCKCGDPNYDPRPQQRGGWNAEEMEHHGTPFHRRWKVLRERIEAMNEATYTAGV
jgi:hypothetical protein